MCLILLTSTRASFNPRLRVGGDACCRASLLSARSFNPRLRVGGDAHDFAGDFGPASFNPRLRVGGDLGLGNVDINQLRVSIHASAWEATESIAQLMHAVIACFNPRLRVGGDGIRGFFAFLKAMRVSIHASAWEATTVVNNRKHRQFMFQSTPPRGRRLGMDGRLIAQILVSIHASAWEATEVIGQDTQTHSVSIHASAWEATTGA